MKIIELKAATHSRTFALTRNQKSKNQKQNIESRREEGAGHESSKIHSELRPDKDTWSDRLGAKTTERDNGKYHTIPNPEPDPEHDIDISLKTRFEKARYSGRCFVRCLVRKPHCPIFFFRPSISFPSNPTRSDVLFVKKFGSMWPSLRKPVVIYIYIITNKL